MDWMDKEIGKTEEELEIVKDLDCDGVVVSIKSSNDVISKCNLVGFITNVGPYIYFLYYFLILYVLNFHYLFFLIFILLLLFFIFYYIK